MRLPLKRSFVSNQDWTYDLGMIRPGPDPSFTTSDGSIESVELRKPHEMVVMVPRSARVTLTARRIYTVLLQVSQTRLDALDAMPPADFMFEAPLAAILRTTGSGGNDRTAAKRYLSEMRSLEVDWESTAPGDGVKWRGFSMLSEVVLEVRRGENWVSWSFPPSIMAVLRDPSRWARIDLEVLAKLGTYAGIALYEICVRYRDNPGGVTSRKPVAWWTDALSNMPGGDRREWRKFKNERIKEAVAEINQETDLEIELIEHRHGRMVHEVQFAVRKKIRVNPRGTGKEPVDANMALRAESLGIREIKLDGLLKEFGDAQVRDKLDALEKRAANTSLRRLDNAYSYLRSLLRNESSAGESFADLGNEEIKFREPAPAMPYAAPPVTPSTLILKDEWLGQRIRTLRTEIENLDAAQRQIWVDRALQDLAVKGLLSPVISRRAAQGDVLHGLLGSKVVQAYAEATYGTAWNVEEGAAGPATALI